jgi:DNA-binding MarR family transcriptional regulator
VEPGISESDLILKVRHAARLCEAILAECYAPFDVGLSRMDVLELLAGLLECGSQSDIAANLRLSESTVCALIDRMQADGLLVRQRSVTDRRRSVLALTEQGQTLLRQAVSVRNQRLQNAFQDWNDIERMRTVDALQNVSQSLSSILGQSVLHSRSQERAA